jgi:hypothetical protein
MLYSKFEGILIMYFYPMNDFGGTGMNGTRADDGFSRVAGQAIVAVLGIYQRKNSACHEMFT